MIDPVVSLAFSLHANKGGYALVLGSGVSRAAQIPTGWEIVLDLVSKVAHLQGQECGGDPAKWYRTVYREEPDYSKLLLELAASPEERQQLLRSYFEPNDDEREQGIKSPTAAHRAIAKLAAEGYVRCIITTNFDRLIERAIEEVGLTPSVASTPDAIEGMLPLVHQRCCVIKVHGDYLDTRIKNAPEELLAYDPRLNALLDRVLDEFGIVACGWSAQWDGALCDAFDRCTTRRFSLYWAKRGGLLDRAERIIRARGGILIEIRDASEFFTDLSEKVFALVELDRPHPLTIASASATTKRLLPDDKQRIRLHDLVQAETERSFAALQPVFNNLTGTVTEERVVAATTKMMAETEVLRAIGAECGYWGGVTIHRPLIASTERLAVDPKAGQSGTHLDDSIRALPALLLMHTIGIAAVAGDNLPMAVEIARGPKMNARRGQASMLTELEWSQLDRLIRTLSAHERHHQPFTEWLYVLLGESLSQIIPDRTKFGNYFLTFELIRSIAFVEATGYTPHSPSKPEEHRVWCPPCMLLRKHAQDVRFNDHGSFLSIAARDRDLPRKLGEAGLFRGDGGIVREVIEFIEAFAKTLASKYF